MALILLQPGLEPLGQFDVLDTDLSSVLGGDVGTLDEDSRTNSSTEKAAQDVLDGYVADGSSTATRPVVRLADNASETRKLFYLLDDGQKNYGTLFGELIGNPVGLATTTDSGGSLLGPHTGSGSGKVTCWDKPGMYAVTTDAVEDALADLTDTPLPGELLFRSTNGKLTSVSGAPLGTSDKLALYVEHASSGSLVTTPNRLVGATETFDRVKLQFLGATHNA